MPENQSLEPTENQNETINLVPIEEDECYYASALDEVERRNFNFAAEVDGIDDEIALLRTEIKKILAGESDPAVLRALIQATNALERLLRTRYEISKDQRHTFRNAVSNVLQDAALTLGVKLGAEFIGKKIGR